MRHNYLAAQPSHYPNPAGAAAAIIVTTVVTAATAAAAAATAFRTAWSSST